MIYLLKDAKKLKKVFKKFKLTFSKKSNTLFDDKELIYSCWITNIFQEAMKVPGHIIEIGVASGRNSLLFGSLLKLTGESNHRKYYGFDTFEGYVEDTISDNPWLSSNSWKNEDCKLDNVKKRIQKADLSETCTFFKGDCRKTIPEFLSTHKDNRIQAGQAVISLLYIDCIFQQSLPLKKFIHILHREELFALMRKNRVVRQKHF